jgi:hypothetical protein
MRLVTASHGVPRVHVLDFLRQGSPYPLHDAFDYLFAAPAAVLRRSSFRCSISILVALKLAPADSDQLSDDRLALSDLATRSPSIVTNTGSLSAATRSAGRFFLGRPPRGLRDWPFVMRVCTGGLPRPTS